MKVMIDRSSFSIALIKIFGFRNKEVRKMYLDGNFYVVALGALISLPLAKLLMDAMYEPAFVPNVACGVDKSFPIWMYVAVLVGILVLYFIIDHLLIYRIRQRPCFRNKWGKTNVCSCSFWNRSCSWKDCGEDRTIRPQA